MELNKNLRFGIPAPYCRHIVVALFYGQTVRHFTLSFLKRDFFNPIITFHPQKYYFILKTQRKSPKTCIKEKNFLFLQQI